MKMGAVIGQLIAQTQKPTGTNLDQKSSAGYKFLQALDKGSVFEGTILEIKNGQVTIGLANGDLLHARLDMDLSFIQGGSLFFQVKAADENQIALKPFAQEPTNNPTLIKALQYAGVEVNSKNLAMVSLMMEEQMPIDKNSILAMAKSLMDCPQSDMRTLIQMNKYQIPINENNVAQYEELRDHQMGITQNIKQMMSDVEQLFQPSAQGDKAHLNLKQIVDFLNMFSKEPALDDAGVKVQSTGEGSDNSGIENLETEILKNNNEKIQAAADRGTFYQGEEVVSQKTLTEKAVDTGVLSDTLLGEQTEVSKHLETLANNQQISGKENLDFQQKINTLLSEWKNSAEGTPDQEQEVLTKVLNEITRQLSGGGSLDSSGLEQFPEHTRKMFQEFVSQLMEKSMGIEPESLQKLPEFFDKLMNQLNHLENVAGEMGKAGSTLMQSAGDLKSQLQFLSDFNQVYHYIQIPLKLKQQTTTGELYVFTHQKKHNLQKKDLSAHLHLEMEHLGSTDVYVKLEEKKVSTHFYLENEQSFDLIMNHLDILTERLNKKGYQVSIQVENTGKKMNIVEDFIDPSTKVGKVQRYTIDVKV